MSVYIYMINKVIDMIMESPDFSYSKNNPVPDEPNFQFTATGNEYNYLIEYFPSRNRVEFYKDVDGFTDHDLFEEIRPHAYIMERVRMCLEQVTNEKFKSIIVMEEMK